MADHVALVVHPESEAADVPLLAVPPLAVFQNVDVAAAGVVVDFWPVVAQPVEGSVPASLTRMVPPPTLLLPVP